MAAVRPFIEALIEALRTAAIWELNGILALLYMLAEHLAGVLTAGACALLLTPPPWRTWPPFLRGVQGQGWERRQWAWGLAVAILAVVAAFLAQPPAPALLAAMALAGALAVRVDRFNPDSLRWRVIAGLALYALATLAHLGYSAYLGHLDALAWAEALGGQGEAAASLAQGRAFVDTLATWGLWLILPLGYFSLLAQGLLVHPPLPATPEEVITAVRTRGQAR